MKYKITNSVWIVSVFIFLAITNSSINSQTSFSEIEIVNSSNDSTFTFWQLPSQSSSQMMSYVIKTLHGNIIVVDGGTTADAKYLKTFINNLGGKVTAWFLTHPHYDHIEALIWNLIDTSKSKIFIKNIYANFSTESWIVEHEKSNAFTIKEYKKAINKSQKKQIVANVGDVITIDSVKIEILYVNTNTFVKNAINNSSMLIRLNDNVKSILFTGDLGFEAGEDILAKVNNKKLKAEYVQMSHHGQDGVGEEFYKLVDADYYLWPTPLWLWENDNGGGKNSGKWKILEVRKWVGRINPKGNYVSGYGLIKFR